MEWKGFRSIGRDAHEALRERAVYLVDGGKTQAEAAGLAGVPPGPFDKSSGAVMVWLARHGQEIEVFYLPADAPEHN
ncbi:MAG: hypothetical protein ACR2KT_13715 [Methylocella sp.]